LEIARTGGHLAVSPMDVWSSAETKRGKRAHIERVKAARFHHSASHADLQKPAAREALRPFFPYCLSCKQHQ